MIDAMPAPPIRLIRSAQLGMLINAVLAIVKLVAGILGNTYALVADAVESTADIFASLVVWGGLRMASRDPDDEHPFGYGKAESLAAAVVSIMLLGASVGIAIEAVREIRTPHNTPAPWTLLVIVGVLVVKFALFRRTAALGAEAEHCRECRCVASRIGRDHVGRRFRRNHHRTLGRARLGTGRRLGRAIRLVHHLL